ncbi:MAG: acyltransferase [Balneolales bacterium]
MLINALKLILSSLADLDFIIFEPAAGKQNARSLHLKLMKVDIGNNFYMGHKIYIRNRGRLKLGERCGIGSFAQIWNYAQISIDDDFLAASNLTLNSATHDPLSLTPQGCKIKIGKRVWCGTNVTILAGVTIGNNVVIGAGSVVVKDIPSDCIAAGVPAKKIRDLDRSHVQCWNPFK